MKITWCGNSYYLIENNEILIAIDPHDGFSLNLNPCRVNADFVIITHNHYDHNAAEIAVGNKTKEVIRDSINIKKYNKYDNFKLEFFELSHDKYDGKIFGKVSAFKIIINDINIVNLSDVGEKFNDSIKNKIGQVDILMIPVGGVTTIDYSEAIEYIEKLKPKMVFPMHYWIKGSTVPYDSIDKFLSNVKYKIINYDTNNIEVEKLPSETEIIILKYDNA